MKPESALKVGILSLSNYITVLVNTVLFPIFPEMAKALDLNLRDLAILVGIVSFPAALINLIGGVLADGLGKKVIIVISLFLYGLGGLLAGLAILFSPHPYPLILLGRFFQGLGAASPMFLTVALVGDLFSSIERSRAMGFLETANGLGKISSPILGGVIGSLFIWYTLFFIYPILAIPIAIATWLFIKEPLEKKGELDWNKHKQGFFLFKDGSRIITLLVAFISIFILIGTMFWLSDFLHATLELTQIIRGVLISLPAISLMLTTLCAGGLAKTIQPRILISIGLLLKAIGLALIVFTTRSWFFWPVIVLIGVGAGLVLPVVDTVSSSVESKDIRGVATTIYGSSRSLGGALAPITFSFLLDLGFPVPFFFIAGVSLLISILVFMLLDEKSLLPDSLLPNR